MLQGLDRERHDDRQLSALVRDVAEADGRDDGLEATGDEQRVDQVVGLVLDVVRHAAAQVDQLAHLGGRQVGIERGVGDPEGFPATLETLLAALQVLGGRDHLVLVVEGELGTGAGDGAGGGELVVEECVVDAHVAVEVVHDVSILSIVSVSGWIPRCHLFPTNRLQVEMNYNTYA